MAYVAGDEQELGRFDKNNRGDMIVVKKVTSKAGNDSIDVRQYYTETDDDGNHNIKPTSKGVRFASEITKDIILAMMKGLDSSEVMDIQDEVEKFEASEDSEEE